jgi:uncharacterized protein (TIGR02186 family)
MMAGRARHLRRRVSIVSILALAVGSGLVSAPLRAQDKKPAAELPNWGAPLGKVAQQRDRKPAQKVQRGKAEPAAKEVVEADVSTRTIAVTSAFAGTEIVAFGSVLNSRQPSAEAGYYDVVVVLEGMGLPLTARRKSNVAGLWVNTSAVAFESVPSYYAIASTRPIEEIADEDILAQHAIGHDFARLSPAARSVIATQPGELAAFREAVVRIKQKEGLFIKEDYAVIFIGKGLFRSSIALPANVPVGPLTARVYLFREGELLSTFQSQVRLEREGIELWLYLFAMRHPALYGLMAVVVAVAAGFLASAAFRRRDAA